jgi:chromosomal replication initiator protein
MGENSWALVKVRLRDVLSEPVYNSWFASMELQNLEAQTARMSVPTKFLKNWIQSHYVEQLLGCWQQVEPELSRVELSVRSAIRISPPGFAERRPLAGEKTAAQPDRSETHCVRVALPDARGGSPLDARLTFDSFVVGRSNTLGHAACLQVAQARRGDPVMFNPLYIHAGVGLGKTHLLQATTHKINRSGERTALYLTAEFFMYRFASALNNKTALVFKDALRGIDVLVIDDLQFLKGKHIPAEFSHTLNSLLDGGRQVVVAADRLPSDLEWLDERVRSRLAGGLVAEIGVLDDGMRLAILRSRVKAAHAHHEGFEVPEQVLIHIARTIAHNGRDLEGALNRLLAQSKLSSQSITMELAERELRDMVRPCEHKKVRIEDIQRAVARRFNVERSDLLSARRTASVVRPRQIAMYLAKVMTFRSLPEIGRRFGGRDHTTVLHAVRKIEALMKTQAALAAEIDALKDELKE